MHRKSEIAFSLFIALAAGWFVWQAVGSGGLLGPPFPRGWGQKSALFPLVIGIPTFVLALVQVAIDIGGRRRVKPATGPGPGYEAPGEPEVSPELVRQRTLVILGTFVGFVIATWLFSFTVAVPLVTFLYLKFGAGEAWRLSLILTVVAGLSFFLVFVQGLGVPMPEGLVMTLLQE
jgi:hypothetical protein